MRFVLSPGGAGPFPLIPGHGPEVQTSLPRAQAGCGVYQATKTWPWPAQKDNQAEDNDMTPSPNHEFNKRMENDGRVWLTKDEYVALVGDGKAHILVVLGNGQRFLDGRLLSQTLPLRRHRQLRMLWRRLSS